MLFAVLFDLNTPVIFGAEYCAPTQFSSFSCYIHSLQPNSGARKMAETACDVETQTVKQPQFTTNVTTLCCESCVVMKDQLIQVFEELKSTRTILTLLQEDIVKLNANHDSKSFQCEQPFVHDQASINWRPVLKNVYKKCKKPTVSNRQLIPLSNRFTPLSDEQCSPRLLPSRKKNPVKIVQHIRRNHQTGHRIRY